MLTQEELATRVSCAKYLVNKRMKTVWDEYDFTGKATGNDAKVPKIEFNSPGVKVMLEEVYHWGTKYVREVQIEFAKMVFIFTVSTRMCSDELKGFNLTVYVPTGDAKGSVTEILKDVI